MPTPVPCCYCLREASRPLRYCLPSRQPEGCSGGAYKADSMPIGGASPQPGGMFPIFLASLKTPKGALEGSLHCWACAKCKAYMGGDVRITPFFSSGIVSPFEVSVKSELPHAVPFFPRELIRWQSLIRSWVRRSVHDDVRAYSGSARMSFNSRRNRRQASSISSRSSCGSGRLPRGLSCRTSPCSCPAVTLAWYLQMSSCA